MRGIPTTRPADAEGSRVADAGRVRAAGGRRRGVARSRRQSGDRASQRVRRPHVRLHVVRRRSAGRPDAGADAGRPGEAARVVRRRHVRQAARSTTSRISASTIAASRAASAGIFPVLYGNGLRIMQTPNEVIISYEMIHDTRVIPLDGRPHVGLEHQAVHGRCARPLGRRHARRRDDELHGSRRRDSTARTATS